MSSPVTSDEILEMLRDLADRIERGGDMKSVTLRFVMDGKEHEHNFSLKTEEERDTALLALRTMLGQLH